MVQGSGVCVQGLKLSHSKLRVSVMSTVFCGGIGPRSDLHGGDGVLSHSQRSRGGTGTPAKQITLFGENEDRQAGYDLSKSKVLLAERHITDGTKATKADVQIALSTNTE
jgi:hypothetical protein